MAAQKSKLINNLPPEVKLKKRARNLVERTAAQVEMIAKQNVVDQGAVDTGNLLNSIHTQMVGPLTAEVGTGVEYAEHVEFGTAKMAPRPYLTPAGESDHVRKNFQSTLSRLLKPE